jgi:hypothetical protein
MQLNSAKIDLEILASGRSVPIKIIQPIGQWDRHEVMETNYALVPVNRFDTRITFGTSCACPP